MANDPNSSVTSADAQKKMVEESEKAGVAAFTFNPNASPEEKAAQARAVSLSKLQWIVPNLHIQYSVCHKDSTTNTSRRV